MRARAAVVAAALVATSAATGAAQAHAPVDPVRLSLQEAVSRGLATSEAIESARTQRALADAQITQARAGAFPQVTGGVV